MIGLKININATQFYATRCFQTSTIFCDFYFSMIFFICLNFKSIFIDIFRLISKSIIAFSFFFIIYIENFWNSIIIIFLDNSQNISIRILRVSNLIILYTNYSVYQLSFCFFRIAYFIIFF